jgi:hypothetical protein
VHIHNDGASRMYHFDFLTAGLWDGLGCFTFPIFHDCSCMPACIGRNSCCQMFSGGTRVTDRAERDWVAFLDSSLMYSEKKPIL